MFNNTHNPFKILSCREQFRKENESTISSVNAFLVISDIDVESSVRLLIRE